MSYATLTEPIRIKKSARQIIDAPMDLSKGSLRRVRHAIQNIVDVSEAKRESGQVKFLRPGSPQKRIQSLLHGRVGLTPSEQADRFNQVLLIANSARVPNRKAKSAGVLAQHALHIIAKRAENNWHPDEDDWHPDEDDWEPAPF